MRRAFLCLLLAGCAAADFSGIYAGGVSADSGAEERRVRLTLKPGGEASVQASFPDRPGRVFSEGTWQQADGRIVVDLTRPRPERIAFSRSGQQLVAREWDRAAWGEEGPGVLYRVVRPSRTE